MTWLLVAAGIALLIPLVTRGSYVRLVDTPFRHGLLLFAGLAIQVALEWAPLPESRWHDVGFGLLVASYVLIVGFCTGNLLARGMSIVLIGVACNFVAIVANQGMPVDVPRDWERDGPVEATVKHRPQEPGDRLLFLTDIVVLRAPFDTVLSFGDLVIAAGLVNVAFAASRAPRRRTAEQPVAERKQRARGDRRDRAGHRPAEQAIDLAAFVLDPDEPARAPAVPRRRATARAHPSNGFGQGLRRLPGGGHAVTASEHAFERSDDVGVEEVARS